MSKYQKNPEALSRLSPEQYRVTQYAETYDPDDGSVTDW
jgi:hypothetical protein